VEVMRPRFKNVGFRVVTSRDRSSMTKDAVEEAGGGVAVVSRKNKTT
jgi:hypothetical protein